MIKCIKALVAKLQNGNLTEHGTVFIAYNYLCLIAMKFNTKRMIKAIAILFLFSGVAAKSKAQDKFEKADFYKVMSNGDIAAIDDEIAVGQNSAWPNKEGYEGALLMKKADLVIIAARKLKFFKAGRIKLETALVNGPNNTEYHFLRLAVEEHAPKIVKYHNDIEADKMIIQKNYKNLSPVVQHAILDYCKKSKVLRTEDL
jgi:hypothetical protein